MKFNRAQYRLTFVACAMSCLFCTVCPAAESASEEFLAKPRGERPAAIVRYSPRDQIDLYLQAMLVKHPPDLSLADALATTGAQLVPSLVRRLVKDEREIAKVYLVEVLWRMKDSGSYDITSDIVAIAIVDDEVAMMKDTQWKGVASDLMNRIHSKSTSFLRKN